MPSTPDDRNPARDDADTTEGPAAPRFRTFAALRHRNYQLFFAGQLISLCGTWMQQMALAWLVYRLTHSAFLLGTIGAIGTTPAALFALVGGSVADRVRKRRLLVVTQSAAMALAFVLAGLTAAGWIRPWQIAVLAALAGVNMAFDMPTRQAFVVEMVGREDLMNAIALNSSIFNGARIVGPALAGLLVARWGEAWCFFANGISFLAVICGLLLMRLPPPAQERRSSGVLADTAEGVRYVRGNPTVLGLAALLGLASIFGWSYAVLMPVFARDILHGGAQALGYLMTANGVGALAGALLVASLAGYPNRASLLFIGGLLLSVGEATFGLSRSFHLSLLLLAVVGLGGVMLMSVANTLLQLSVPDHLRGRVMGVWALVFLGTTPISNFQAGALAGAFGAPVSVVVGGVLNLVSVGAGFVVWLRRRAARNAGDGVAAEGV